MRDGWIKLHRKILENPIFENPKLLKMWIWCLLKASHKDKIKQVGLNQIEVKQGQFITGRLKGSMETNLNQATWYKYLKALEKLQYITINSNNKMTIVTIVNWGKYQSDTFEKEQQSNNKVTTKEQQSNNKVTTKEQQSNNKVTHTRIIKNDKNDKNINNNRRKRYADDSTEVRVATQLVEILVEKKPDTKLPNIQTWAHDVDKLIRLDKKTPEQIVWLFRWAQNDDFWIANMRSPRKLRDKWDMLQLQATNKSKKKKSSDDDWRRKTMEALNELKSQ